MERIICAGVHYNNGEKCEHQPTNIKSGFVVAGLRHQNAVYTKCLMNLPNAYQVEQGFITSENRFVDRIEAFEIAKEAKQIKNEEVVKQRGKKLTSDDLY
jgi:hypothetical protein